MNIRDAFTPKEPRTARWSDPMPYSDREPVIDPLTQRPVILPPRTGNTSDQAIERGHILPDPTRPQTWPDCGSTDDILYRLDRGAGDVFGDDVLRQDAQDKP